MRSYLECIARAVLLYGYLQYSAQVKSFSSSKLDLLFKALSDNEVLIIEIQSQTGALL
jgi:hypothetical protein